MADIKRAKESAKLEAIRRVSAIYLSVLRDKEGFKQDDLCRVFTEVCYLSDSVDRGYTTIANLCDTLYREEGIRLVEEFDE